MDFKNLDEKMFEKAVAYVPLLKKVQFTDECAAKCFDRMELKLDSGETIPYYKENVERRTRYLMGALVVLYLGQKIEPVEDEVYLLSADDYDRWAGGHVLNQIERRKARPETRDKAFDLLSDYRELEKMFKTEIYSLLQAMNDPVSRMQENMAKAITPEVMQKNMAELRKVQQELANYRKKGNRK